MRAAVPFDLEYLSDSPVLTTHANTNTQLALPLISPLSDLMDKSHEQRHGNPVFSSSERPRRCLYVCSNHRNILNKLLLIESFSERFDNNIPVRDVEGG